AAPALAQAATILAEVKARQRRERRCHRSKPCLDRPVLVLKMCGSIHPDAHPARRKGTPGAMKTLLSDKVLRRLVLGNLLVAGLLGLATWLSLRANHQADLDLGVAVTQNQARSLSLELTAEMR